MYDSIQFSKATSSRRTSQVTRRKKLHSLIGGLQPAAPLLAGRIAIPLLLLSVGLILVQPSAGQSGTWTETGNLAEARRFHTATLLPNGKVLAACGDDGFSALTSAELYDPTSGTWTVTGSLATGRIFYTATLLPYGKVLVAGGQDIIDIPFASAELYLGPATAPTLLNISTRMRVLTGDQVLFGGFMITGSDPDRVLIRAIGPSLSDFGAPEVLANPTLELHSSDGSLIGTNDDWKSLQQADIEATGLQPTNDLESAILATLDPGPYTAIVRGVNSGTGVGLIETYDLDQVVDSSLANISTRGLVDQVNAYVGKGGHHFINYRGETVPW